MGINKTDNMIAWMLNQRSTLPHPQFAKLQEIAKYMEMLNTWAR